MYPIGSVNLESPDKYIHQILSKCDSIPDTVLHAGDRANDSFECTCTEPRISEDPEVGLLLCCRHFETLNI